MPAGSQLTFTLSGIVNPSTTGTTAAFTAVSTLSGTLAVIDDAGTYSALPPGILITAASFVGAAAPAVALSSYVAGAAGVTATLSFTPALTIPVHG